MALEPPRKPIQKERKEEVEETRRQMQRREEARRQVQRMEEEKRQARRAEEERRQFQRAEEDVRTEDELNSEWENERLVPIPRGCFKLYAFPARFASSLISTGGIFRHVHCACPKIQGGGY